MRERRGPYFHGLQMRPERPPTKQQLSFDVSKKNALAKFDKSPKGSLDAPIAAFVYKINAHADYVTTSTCSGRVALFASASAGRGGRWLLVEHRTVTLNEVAAAIGASSSSSDNLLAPPPLPADGSSSSSDRVVSLKVEPAILHVQCRDSASARKLLALALQSGFRESGLVLSESSAKVMLAIRTTSNCLEMPIALMMAGEEDAASEPPVADACQPLPLRPLIDGGTLRFVVSHANEKFEANAKRTALLEEAFDTMVLKEQELRRQQKEQEKLLLAEKSQQQQAQQCSPCSSLLEPQGEAELPQWDPLKRFVGRRRPLVRLRLEIL